MTDIYKPPTSDVTSQRSEIFGDIFVFDRFSTWYVLGLSIVTFNLYAPYWLYTRTKKLNAIVRFKISMLYCQITVTMVCLLYAVGVFREIEDLAAPYLALAHTILILIVNTLNVVWVYKFRNRLNDTFVNENIHMGIVAPFFFLHLFLQYKINELIEKSA